MTRTRLGLTGDVMFGRLVDDNQRRRSADAVWREMLDRLRSLDGLAVNLECCLSTRGTAWTRTHHPFHFRADPDWAVPALDRAGVDHACLANNHVLDFGEDALLDTLDHLSDAGVAHSGAGETIDEALDPAVVSVGGLRTAFVSFTDNAPEYAAGPDSPGTAHVTIDADDERTRETAGEALSRARARDPDLVVASLHWGPNMVEEPPKSFRAFGRWLVDAGVDLIHGHSAHVPQGIEIRDGTPICYDTGDFVDDYAVDSDLRNDRSFLFEVGLGADGTVEGLRLVPTEIDDYAVREARPEAAEWSRDRMRELSAPFGTEFERDGEALVVSIDA